MNISTYFRLWIIILFLSIGLNNSSAQLTQPEYYIVSVSPDESMVAGVANNGSMIIWDSLTGNILFNVGMDFNTVLLLNANPLSITWHPQSHYIATAGGDTTIYIWCVDRRAIHECTPGTLVREIEGHTDPLIALAWNSDGRLASAGQIEFKTLIVWDSNNNYQMLASSTINSIQQMDWRPMQNRLALATRGAGIYLFSGNLELDLTSTWSTDQLLEPNVSALSVQWSSDGSRLAVGTEAYGTELGRVYIMDPTSPNPLAVYNEHTQSIYSVVWSPDDTKLAAAEADGIIKVWGNYSGWNVGYK